MARISKDKLDRAVLDKIFILFFEIVGKHTQKDMFQNVINDLLSPIERIMIAKRIALMYLILKGVDYSTISEKLKVSSSTIAKFVLLIERSNGIIPIFNKLLKYEKAGQTLEEFWIAIFGPGLNWKAVHEHKRNLEHRKKEGF